jgi:hypothetical protein
MQLHEAEYLRPGVRAVAFAKYSPVANRHCVVCDELLVRHPGEKLKVFALRKTCGLTCGHKATIRVPVVEGRCCVVCDTTLKRRPKEAAREFNERKLCNKTCADELARRRAPAVDFYGIALPVGTIAEILGVSRDVILSRQRTKRDNA